VVTGVALAKSYRLYVLDPGRETDPEVELGSVSIPREAATICTDREFLGHEALVFFLAAGVLIPRMES